MKGRTIIRVQGIVISAMLTETVARIAYHDLRGWRLAVVIVAVFMLLYRTHTDIMHMILKGAKNDKETGTESAGSAVQRKPWYEVRLCTAEPHNRHTGKHTAQVQSKSRINPIRKGACGS